MKKEFTSNFLVVASLVLVLISELLNNKSVNWLGYAAIVIILIAVFRMVKGYLE